MKQCNSEILKDLIFEIQIDGNVQIWKQTSFFIFFAFSPTTTNIQHTEHSTMGDLHYQDRFGESSSLSSLSTMTICSVNDYQTLAKRKLSKALYEYLASGTDDEQTLSENRSAYKAWYLRPRVLRPLSNLTTSTTLFGRQYSMPVFVSPAGVHALCHDDGECATARACQSVGILFGHSQHATKSIEEVAMATSSSTTFSSSPSSRWYQAYILKDRDLIQRAKKTGCHGIFLTVDSIKFGFREADARNG
jgi:(S)-2-hydroxy-acid oxidase